MEIEIFGFDSPFSGSQKYITSISGTSASFDNLYGNASFLTGIVTGATSTTDKIGSTILNGNTLNLTVNESNLSIWPLVVKGNSLLSGGASLLTGLTFTISPLSYIIGSTIYTLTGSSNVTLTTGDTTNNRIDVIYVDISGNTGVVQGVASPSPVKPEINPSTQVEITFVTVLANSSETAVSTTLVYNEAVGPPTEWGFYSPASTALISGSSVSQAYNGTKSIEWTNVTESADNYFVLSAATPFDSISQNVIQFAIKNKLAWNPNSKLRFQFLSSVDVPIGNVFDLTPTNSYGFSPSNIASWQIVALPLSVFSLSTSVVSKLKISSINQGSQSLSLFLDFIRFQEGVPTVSAANQWLNILADNGTSLQAATPTDTLILSGGTNVYTSTNGLKTIVINLDDNITINSLRVTGTTLSNIFSGSTTPAIYYGDGSNLTGTPDNFVTGGTYSNGTLTLNRQNGVVTVNGFSTGGTGSDTYVTGFTYNSSNLLTISQNGGQPPLSVGINNMSGLTINGVLSATTLQVTSIKIDGPTTAGYVLTADVNGNGTWQVTSATGTTASGRITSTVTTTNATPTVLDAIDTLTNDATNLVDVYIKAYTSAGAQWGIWKRTLAVTKVSNVVTIQQVNADVDKQSSGLKSYSLTFVVNSGNIDITVTGIAATTINWKSAYEIIL